MNKLFKPVLLAFMLAFSISLFMPLSGAYAADTSQAKYTMVIRITNTGADAYNVTVPVSINTSYLINNGYIAANLSNTAVLDYRANSTAYAPAISTNTTWVVFVPYIAASSTYDYRLYLGGPAMSGNLSLFPANTTGLTTADADSLELGNNFSISQTGFLNTSYAVGKNLTAKTGALVVNVTAEGNVTANYAGNRSQMANSGVYYLDSSGGALHYTRIGQKFVNFPASTVNTVFFSLSKEDFPTGNAYATVRRFSDDALVGNLGTLNVATLGTTASWVGFSTPVTVNSSISPCFIGIEYYGGNSTDYVKVHISPPTSVYPNENLVYFVPGGGGYAEPTFLDLAYNLTAYTTCTASNISTGLHNLTVSGNNSDMSIIVDSVVKNTNIFFPYVSNANAWSFAQNQSYTTFERQTITVNNTLVQDIRWTNGLVWLDTSGYGNNATVSLRTNVSHTGITASMVDFRVENEQILTDWEVGGSSSGDSPIPGQPSQMYDSLNATFPGAGILDDVEAAGNVPVGTMWFMIPGLVIVVLGMIIHDKTKSLAAQFIVILICMIFLSLAHVWALWMIIPFSLMAGACLVQNKVIAI